MASGGHGYGGGAGGNNHHAATGGAGAWDSLNYLDVLKEVYSSLVRAHTPGMHCP